MVVYVAAKPDGDRGMMDYYGYWNGFVFAFGIVPFVVGASGGAIWAWRRGKRGAGLLPGAILGGIGLALCVFGGVIAFIRF